MSIWVTIADPRDSTGNTKIKLYSKLGQQILVKYEKHQVLMDKQGKQNIIWDKILNPDPSSKRKVLLTGKTGQSVLSKYRATFNNLQKKYKQSKLTAQTVKNILSMKKQLKKKHDSKPKLFKNPYLEKSKNTCSITKIFIKKIKEKARKGKSKKDNKIIINQTLLRNLGFMVRGKISIKIPFFTHKGTTVNKLSGYLALLCDAYKRLAGKTIVREDFFTRPDAKTANDLRIFKEIKKTLILYIFSFINGGGFTDSINFNVDNDYVDDFANMMMLVPVAPTSSLQSQLVMPEVPTTPLTMAKTGTLMLP